MTHIYQGNIVAIVKAMQKKTVGDKKVMIFTPGYGHISVFDSPLALNGLNDHVPR